MPLSSVRVVDGQWDLLSPPQESKVLTMCLTTSQLRPMSPWSQRWTQVGNLGTECENVHQCATFKQLDIQLCICLSPQQFKYSIR